MKNGMRR